MKKEIKMGKGKNLIKALKTKTGRAVKKVNKAIDRIDDKRRDVKRELNKTVNKAIPSFVNKLINGRKDYPPSVKRFLDNHGDEIIVSLTVSRTPIPKAIQSFISVFSKIPYDKLFHLRVYATTNKGLKFVMEKNEVLNIGTSYTKDTKETEQMKISYNGSISIDEFLDKCRQKMGKKFFTYSASSNNCQDFLYNLLTSNGITGNNILTFVKQNTTTIFKNKPNLRKFANTLTDLGGRVDVLKNRG